MTDVQKAICRELLAEAYKSGFDGMYPLKPVAEKLGIKETLYDVNTNTGILWDLGPHGKGLLDINSSGTYAAARMETRDLLAHWCDFRP